MQPLNAASNFTYLYQPTSEFTCSIEGMKRSCPNLSCNSSHIIKDGSYRRTSDSRHIQRFKCNKCGKRFSAATGKLEYQHKKRRINYPFFQLYCSGVSLRRLAILLNVSRTTVARKLVYLGKKCRFKQKNLLAKLKVDEIQFDDLITSHHTKLKPLTMPIAVEASSRMILAGDVAQIPAFGRLAKNSVRKYGKRRCHHQLALNSIFEKIKVFSPQLIRSDEHHRYRPTVQRFFPNTKYKQHKSVPARVAGQGEMKKGGYDPIFTINQTLAMLRDNINRLFRRTWNTTKKIDRLKDHLDVYIWYHNTKIAKEIRA